MIKLIVGFGVFCFFSCGDKEKTNQEKVIGTWVGNICGSTSNLNKDTFHISTSTINQSGVNGNYSVTDYNISGSNIFYNNSKIFSLEFTSASLLKLTQFTLIGEKSYCLTKI